MALAFLSYRRDDTSQVAQALYLQLKEQFGSGQLFMDVNSIRAGEAWPERIRRKLEEATLVLPLIGPGWLRAADKYGRRRIDDDNDWVRNELIGALQRRIPIVPIVINHTANLPDPEGLPPPLQPLPLLQTKILRLDPAEWAGDVRTLSEILVDRGFRPRELPSQPRPSERIRRDYPPLTDEELAAAMAELPEWEQWSDSLALEYPRIRQELQRTFQFKKFVEAIEFMHWIARRFDETRPPHHPRWGNDWKSVRIRLTTWDVGNKITALDVKTAKMIDAQYETFKGRA